MKRLAAILALALLLAAVALFASCTYSVGRQVPLGVVERGWTTAQVRVRLGDPQVTTANPDGSETWTYIYSEYDYGTYIIPFTTTGSVRVETVQVLFVGGTVVGGTEAIFATKDQSP